jgi:hypothetical protein
LVKIAKYSDTDNVSWGQNYDLVTNFAKKIGKKLAFLTQNKAKL